MKLFDIFACALLLSAVAGCSSSGTSGTENTAAESRIFDYKAPPKSAPKLEVPPELSAYVTDDRFGIPGEGESGTRYSDFLQGGSRKPTTTVLPPARNVHLERSATERWLVVNDKAENVWPIVKSFWEENGLTIKVDNPQAGIMETDWLENRAKLPNDVVRQYLGKVFDGLMSSGERDQYHTRLSRSKDGNSTEIYITHYGLQEVQNKDETEFRWISRPSDPELEATMLQLLMNKLAGGSGVLDKNAKPAKTEDKAVASAPRLNKLADGSQTILLAEPFDKSWRKVGLALEQSAIALADKDRSKGIYYLSAGKDDVKLKPGSEKIQRMQVVVREITAGSEVAVNNGAGAATADTQKILDTLYKALGRQ